MRKSGYTDGTSRAGSQYNRLRKITRKYFDEEYIEREIKKALKDFKLKDDNNNRSRMLELMSKVRGMTKDTIKHEGNRDMMVINFKDKPPTDDKPTELDT